VPTPAQELGDRGERAVRDHVICPRCNRTRQFRPLPKNFECVDVICKFCGFLAQVKATDVGTSEGLRRAQIPGGAWGPQHLRIVAGIFHGLYVVCFQGRRLLRIDYIPAHMLQAYPSVYKPRRKLSATAKRAGWQGFMYDLAQLPPVASLQVYPADALPD
jgi:type II restriction enzyme